MWEWGRGEGGTGRAGVVGLCRIVCELDLLAIFPPYRSVAIRANSP